MWIRIFRTKKEAIRAKNILEEAGILATIEHDKFENVPIEKYGVPARWRVNIASQDLNRAAKFLASKLKRRNSNF